jgi:hypothetical protein
MTADQPQNFPAILAISFYRKGGRPPKRIGRRHEEQSRSPPAQPNDLLLPFLHWTSNSLIHIKRRRSRILYRSILHRPLNPSLPTLFSNSRNFL